MRVDIKPISVNTVWQGRRYKTEAYKVYEEELMFKLPNKKIPSGKLELIVKFGFSSKNADIDNPLKPFLDVLQKYYDFNDRRVYRLIVEKEDVKKGEEYIDFQIKKWDN